MKMRPKKRAEKESGRCLPVTSFTLYLDLYEENEDIKKRMLRKDEMEGK